MMHLRDICACVRACMVNKRRFSIPSLSSSSRDDERAAARRRLYQLELLELLDDAGLRDPFSHEYQPDRRRDQTICAAVVVSRRRNARGDD